MGVVGDPRPRSALTLPRPAGVDRAAPRSTRTATLAVDVAGRARRSTTSPRCSRREQTLLPLWNSLVLSMGTAVDHRGRLGARGLPAVAVPDAVPQVVPVRDPLRHLPADHGDDGAGLRAVRAPATCSTRVPGTIFFMAATSLPMAIWMTKNFMDSVPISLEEAAWVDGASAMTALRGSSCRSCGPASPSCSSSCSSLAWGNFFVPFVLLLQPGEAAGRRRDLQLLRALRLGRLRQLAAFSILYAAPVMVLYVLCPAALRRRRSPSPAPSRADPSLSTKEHDARQPPARRGAHRPFVRRPARPGGLPRPRPARR